MNVITFLAYVGAGFLGLVLVVAALILTGVIEISYCEVEGDGEDDDRH